MANNPLQGGSIPVMSDEEAQQQKEEGKKKGFKAVVVPDGEHLATVVGWSGPKVRVQGKFGPSAGIFIRVLPDSVYPDKDATLVKRVTFPWKDDVPLLDSSGKALELTPELVARGMKPLTPPSAVSNPSYISGLYTLAEALGGIVTDPKTGRQSVNLDKIVGVRCKVKTRTYKPDEKSEPRSTVDRIWVDPEAARSVGPDWSKAPAAGFGESDDVSEQMAQAGLVTWIQKQGKAWYDFVMDKAKQDEIQKRAKDKRVSLNSKAMKMTELTQPQAIKYAVWLLDEIAKEKDQKCLVAVPDEPWTTELAAAQAGEDFGLDGNESEESNAF